MNKQERTISSSSAEKRVLSPAREHIFRQAENELHFPVQVYRLDERFRNLPSELDSITMLDTTRVPGCHYGVRNVFVPIIRHLEETGTSINGQSVAVSPDNAILVEPSTGNGWVAFSDAAKRLCYEHLVVMPDGLPEARYRHPSGRPVEVLRTPTEEYALGMPKALMSLIRENRQRHAEGKKIYVTPNHPVGAADITVETMSDLGKQLLDKISEPNDSLRVVVSMGNGASLCALGEYVKVHRPDSKITATESFAYGGGYDRFAQSRGLPRYEELFDIEPGDPALMTAFSTYGTNAPIGIELPLQTRAINGDTIDDYLLVSDGKVIRAYENLWPMERSWRNALSLPNYSNLPQELIDIYGNSTLANIAAASVFSQRGEQAVAMAYDGRENY